MTSDIAEWSSFADELDQHMHAQGNGQTEQRALPVPTVRASPYFARRPRYPNSNSMLQLNRAYNEYVNRGKVAPSTQSPPTPATDSPPDRSEAARTTVYYNQQFVAKNPNSLLARIVPAEEAEGLSSE